MKKISAPALVMAFAFPPSVIAASDFDSSAAGVAYFGKVFQTGGIDGVDKEIKNFYKSASDIIFVEMYHGLDFAAGFAAANIPQLLTAKNDSFFSIGSRFNRLSSTLRRFGISGYLAENKPTSCPRQSMAAFQKIYMSK